MSRLLRHGPCPECGSRDNLSIYDDHEHCFEEDCDYDLQYETDGERTISDAKETEDKPAVSLKIGLPSKTQPAIDARGLDATTVNKYKVSVGNDSTDIEAVFPRFSDDGDHIANQIKVGDKKFKCEGAINKATLFGQNVFPAGGKSITITEGYYDAMAAFQMTGSRYPNVGVMSASSAKKELVDNFEYVESFDKIVLNFDNDGPGQNAAKECAQLFTPGKVHIMCLEKAKDANEYLLKNLGKDYINEWFRAPKFLADGLVVGDDPMLLDEIVNYKEPESVPYPWEGLNRATYGLRLSEFTLFTADTGIGKTTFMKEIEYALLTNEELAARGYGVGFLHLEEPKRETALGLMSIHKNKPYHLPDTEKTAEELTEVYNQVVKSPRVVIWDHFGSNDVDVVISKIRHMVALGCRYIVIDHLSIIVSDQAGDERKQLDEISTKLKTMTMNLGICCVCVIHINRQGQVRGSAGPEQVSNNVIRLERDKQEVDEWRRNVTRMVVEKCRLSGRTGPSAWVWYNPITGRLQELTQEERDSYEQGGSNTGHEFAGFSSKDDVERVREGSDSS